MTYGRDRTLVRVDIATGTALSGEVVVGAKRIVGIQMSAAWTAAALTFQAVVDQAAGNPPAPVYGEVVDEGGTAISIATPGAGAYISLVDTRALIALGRIKVRSGTSGAPVNQAAARVLYLVCIDD